MPALSDREFRQMYESTIRQEERQKVQDQKLDTIHKRLDEGDAKFDDHAMQLADLKADHKRRSWWFRLAASAMAIPGAAWAWDHLTRMFAGPTPPTHP